MSCSKGSPVQDPAFGSLTFSYLTSENITVKANDDQKILPKGTAIQSIAGKNRFRFYKDDVLLKDTLLSVEPFVNHDYFVFKPGQQDRLQVVDKALNGLKDELPPDSGTVKISFANLNYALPDKINIVVTTTTYVNNIEREIQVGEFLNVERSFSPFRVLAIGKGRGAGSFDTFRLSISDPSGPKILGTGTFILPLQSPNGTLINNILLVYLAAGNSANMLMSR